jgi:hypothetical protein
LAPLDAEVDTVDGDEGSEPLGEAAGFDERRRARAHPCSIAEAGTVSSSAL